MRTVRLSTKGRLVVAKEIRTSHAWRPGTKFTIDETNEGILLGPLGLFPRTALDRVVGCLKYKGRPATLAETDAAVGRNVKRRLERGRY